MTYSREEIENAHEVFRELVKINDMQFPGSSARVIAAMRVAEGLCEHMLKMEGYVLIPTNRAEAEAMHLISESWLKNHVTSESNGGAG